MSRAAAPATATSTQPATRLGLPRVHLRRTGSTNERARELAFAGAPHGALVTAAEQSAGRGRHGRRWSAPASSSLLMSLVLRELPPLLPLAAAVAVCDVAGPRARIKWPNDIVLEADGPGRELAKLSGILIEGRPQQGWAVLGIGLNVAVRIEQLPAELHPGSRANAGERAGLPAATLGLTAADVEALLAALLDALARRLAEPPHVTLDAWRARDALHGREIVWGAIDAGDAAGAQDTADAESAVGAEDAHDAWTRLGCGRAAGIDAQGRLLVALADGRRTNIGAGEVHLQAIGRRI